MKLNLLYKRRERLEVIMKEKNCHELTSTLIRYILRDM